MMEFHSTRMYIYKLLKPYGRCKFLLIMSLISFKVPIAALEFQISLRLKTHVCLNFSFFFVDLFFLEKL